MDESSYAVGVERVRVVLLEEQIRQLGPEAMEELLADGLLDNLQHALVLKPQIGHSIGLQAPISTRLSVVTKTSVEHI